MPPGGHPKVGSRESFAVMVKVGQGKAGAQPFLILLQAAIAHVVKPKARLRMGYSTLVLTRALVRILRFSASSTPAFVFTRREIMSCGSGTA